MVSITAIENKVQITMGFFDSWSDMVAAATPWSTVEAEAPAKEEEKEEDKEKVCLMCLFARYLCYSLERWVGSGLVRMWFNWLLCSRLAKLHGSAEYVDHGRTKDGWRSRGIVLSNMGYISDALANCKSGTGRGEVRRR